MTAAVGLGAAIVVGLAAVALVGPSGSADDRPRVYAAASLGQALPALDPRPRYSFGGSNQLRRQIAAGAPADVFAAASPEEPAALFEAGRCTSPRPFATNRLAILVPRAGRSAVGSARDLARPGLRLAMGAATVPAGRAARRALTRLDIALDRAVVSAEPSVAGVVAKVAAGSADAGIGYVTDARAARTRIRAVPFPARANPWVEYHACAVLRDGADSAAAEAFLERLTGPAGRAALRAAGFGLPGS